MAKIIRVWICLLVAASILFFLPIEPIFADDAEILAATVCDVNDGPFSFESEHFHINYSTIEGGLTIEDYAAQLEAAYALEVIAYQWAAPPLCTAAACGGDANPWGKYPVQVTDTLGEGLLGYVTGGGLYGGYIIGDNPNTAATETFSSSTCMVLPNDFSAIGADPIRILKETVAHEFMHAIQEGYGDDPAAQESAMWYESTAVYIEDELIDESVNDNQYLWPSVENCLADWPNSAEPEEVSEYSNFLLFRYAAERNGGANLAGGGENVIQSMWENIGAEQPAITAFDNALRTNGSNLSTLFHDYAISVKFSRSCTGGYTAPYCFEEGDEYRSTSFDSIRTHGSIAANNASAYNGTIKDDYAINWINLPTNSLFDLTLQNSASGGELQASVACDTGSQIRVTPFPTTVGSGGAIQLTNIDTTGCIDVVAAITNQSRSANANVCTPRSYILSKTDSTVPDPDPDPQPTNRRAYLPIIALSP